jgi:hypothetical protein
MFGRKSLPAIEKQESASGADDQQRFRNFTESCIGLQPTLVVMYEEGSVP